MSALVAITYRLAGFSRSVLLFHLPVRPDRCHMFMGKIQPGSRVLIVDDVVIYGSTLTNLRGWLEQQGATVVGATTLTAGFGGTKLALPLSCGIGCWIASRPRPRPSQTSLGFLPIVLRIAKPRFLTGLKSEYEMQRFSD
jgi:hypothetical protein